MAFCSKCGTDIAEANFCSKCGTAAGGGGAAPSKPATEKLGNIRKCPACGAEVPAMTAVCADCGHEFANVQVNTAVKDFFEKLDAINQDVYEKEASKDAKGPLGGAMGAMFGLDQMVKQREALTTSAGAKRQIGLIESFPIPNAKEDILEFILLASSRYKGIKKPNLFAKASGMASHDEYSIDAAWKVKCEQAYTKAKISFGSDKNAIEEITQLLKEKKIV